MALLTRKAEANNAWVLNWYKTQKQTRSIILVIHKETPKRTMSASGASVPRFLQRILSRIFFLSNSASEKRMTFLNVISYQSCVQRSISTWSVPGPEALCSVSVRGEEKRKAEREMGAICVELVQGNRVKGENQRSGLLALVGSSSIPSL
jgi:hypothetical protein